MSAGHGREEALRLPADKLWVIVANFLATEDAQG